MICNYSFTEAHKAQRYVSKQPPCRQLDSLYNTMNAYRDQLYAVSENAKKVREEAESVMLQIAKTQKEVKSRISDLNMEIASTPTETKVKETYYDDKGEPHTREKTVSINQDKIRALREKVAQLERCLRALETHYKECENIQQNARYIQNEYYNESYNAGNSASRIFDTNSSLKKEISDLENPVANAISAMNDFRSVRVYWNFNYSRGYFKEIGDK